MASPSPTPTGTPGLSAPGTVPAEKKRSWHKGKLRYVFFGVGAAAVVYGHLQFEQKPVLERKALDNAMVDRVQKTPGVDDAQRNDARGAYIKSAATFVDQQLSWKVTSGPGVTPVTSEPTAAIKQLGAMANELGRADAFKSFVDMNQYRWTDTKNSRLAVAKSIAVMSNEHQQIHTRSTITSTERLLEKMQENPQFSNLIKEPRFKDAAAMMAGFKRASLNSEIGVGYKPLPKISTGNYLPPTTP
jgi:hypothetical protein